MKKYLAVDWAEKEGDCTCEVVWHWENDIQIIDEVHFIDSQNTPPLHNV